MYVQQHQYVYTGRGLFWGARSVSTRLATRSRGVAAGRVGRVISVWRKSEGWQPAERRSQDTELSEDEKRRKFGRSR